MQLLLLHDLCGCLHPCACLPVQEASCIHPATIGRNLLPAQSLDKGLKPLRCLLDISVCCSAACIVSC